MTIDDVIVAQHLDLAGTEGQLAAALASAVGAAVEAVDVEARRHVRDDDSFGDGWWLALAALLGAITGRLTVRLTATLTARLILVAGAAPLALERALIASGDERPLTPIPDERLSTAALAGLAGQSWDGWMTKAADDWKRHVVTALRAAGTLAVLRAELARSRRLANAALAAAAATALHAAANRARMVVAEADGRFTGWRFAAVLDSRTTALCRSLDGSVWVWRDPNAPVPPLHVNCRSIQVPVEGPR